jgi:hypothetical protein
MRDYISKAEMQALETIIRELPKLNKVLDNILTELKNDKKQ